ncbi:MAG: hypothetical protein LBD32_02390 [Cytophagales bacterium]|jgi:hypothetical protein|nr:hypothetical protein [Cytophagales bacterium]
MTTAAVRSEMSRFISSVTSYLRQVEWYSVNNNVWIEGEALGQRGRWLVVEDVFLCGISLLRRAVDDLEKCPGAVELKKLNRWGSDVLTPSFENPGPLFHEAERLLSLDPGSRFLFGGEGNVAVSGDGEM